MKTNFSKMRNITIILVLVLAICNFHPGILVARSEQVIPQAESNFYVNDFANLFSDNQKSEMLNRAVELSEKADGIQVVVTAITSLNGMSINDYATSMYNKYGIGKDDRGLLILLSTTDRQIWVEVGYGLESVYTARKTGQFIDDYAISYLANNKFADGLVALQKAFVEDLTKRFVAVTQQSNDVENLTRNTTQSSSIEEQPIADDASKSNTESQINYSSRTAALIAVLTLLVVGLVICFFEIKKSKKVLIQKDDKNGELNDLYKSLNSKFISLSQEKSALENQCSSLQYVVNSQESEINRLKGKVEFKDEKIKKLEKDVKTAVEKFSELDKERLNLMERFRHARMIYSNLDSEIDAHIQKEKDNHNKLVAANYDDEYQFLEDMEASLDNSLLIKVKEALAKYDVLTSDVKKYVKTKISKIQQLLIQINDLNARQNAEKLNEKIRKTCEGVTPGSENKLSELIELNKQVDSLPSNVNKYIDAATVVVLAKLVEKGLATRNARIEAEEKEREEERKRRREEERKRQEREEEERKRRREEERKRQEREEEERRRRRKEERKRQEREEEDRRRMSSSNSFSHHSNSFSSSHHSGFGGHSGGSGAGRSF